MMNIMLYYLEIKYVFIRIARASSHVANFNAHNKLLTQKLLKQGDPYHKLCRTSSKFIDDTMF